MVVRLERGSCFCGGIVAELEGEPFWINYDHDDDCRKAIGSPLTVWIGYPQNKVTFTNGVPRTFSKTPGISRGFCPNCGSSISYVDTGLREEIWISVGFMDHPERFEPVAHGYWRMKLPWVNFADALPRFETYTRERDVTIGYPVERQGGEKKE